MTICRFYQTNSCRYGSRCKYEHVIEDSAYGYDSRQKSGVSVLQRSQPSDGRSRQDYNHYEDRNRYNQEQSYKERRGPEGNRYNEPSSQNRNVANRYELEDARYAQNRYRQESSYQNRYSQNRYAEDRHRYNQNRYNQEPLHHNRYESEGTSHNRYNESSPSQDSFSQNRLKQYAGHQGTNSKKVIKEVLEIISKEMVQIEQNHMWPLTCFGIIKNHGNLPGSVDYSPEELRAEAYKAQKEGNFESAYILQVHSLLETARQIRNFYLHPTETAIVNYLGQTWNDPSQPQHSVPEQPRVASFSFENSPAFGSFAQQQHPQFSESPLTNNIFSNVIQQVTQQQHQFGSATSPGTFGSLPQTFPVSIPGGDRNRMVEPKIEDLTPEELQQFRASTFTYGLVPTIPPPDELCSK